MNILCFLSGNILSGKEFVGLDVIRNWKQKGHNVEVAFMGWHDGKVQQQLNSYGVPNHPIKLGWYYLTKIKWSLDSLIHYPSAIRQYIRLQRRVAPDIIYVDSYRQVILLSPYLRKKVLFHVHDPHSHFLNEKWLLRMADKKVSKYIAVSEFIKQDLINSGIEANKITVVYNGVNIPAAVDKKYMPVAKIRIGVVGLVLPRKGHEDVLNACKLLLGKIPFELYIYGKGDESFVTQLKQTIADAGMERMVQWKGFESDKDALYNNLDVVIAATRNDEPFGLIVAEAGARKIPVIATRSGAFTELVVDGITGFIVPKQAPESIADKLNHLYSHAGALQQMGDAAYKHVSENFSIALTNEKMEKLVESFSS